MKVPLTIRDHLRRAAVAYPDRIGVIDEPDQPAPSLGSITYRRMAELATAQAARLDALGVGFGERVAVVSQNSARLLVSLFGIPVHGRVVVPINFRLNADEVGYIVEHSGASVLLVDPEVDEQLAGVTAKRRYVIGAESDAALHRYGVEPVPWEPDEDATATINYT
ncbi:MAG: class I adenylate-forming enzyme family protein, partial [Acidimicrobiia bacterium]